MKVFDLEGRPHSLDLRGKVPLGTDSRPRSSLHLRARALLTRLFPLDLRAEEVELPGLGLYADFLLPAQKMVVEVQGSQHSAYNAFFHPTRLDFIEALGRDRNKAAWCEINGFRLVLLQHNADDVEWARLLVGAS